jgi:glycosyltransferase involved in cell wall biosynthesis
MIEPNRVTAPPRGRVAVVIPCFNDGATLGDAVSSATAQDRLDELVVVDDGSTEPATVTFLESLAQSGVRVVSRANGGLGVARMTGVEATSADYVFPLDADDRLVPGALGALAAKLDAEPALALTWGDYELFGARRYRQQTAATLDPWQITYQNDLPASALIRRSALTAAGGWELRGGYEDWDLWMALAERGERGVRVPIVAYQYRQHGPRMLEGAAGRHEEIYALLRSRHQRLFAARRRSWRESDAPLLLRCLLPAIFALPVPLGRRRVMAGAANHLAHRRGVRVLARRAAAPRVPERPGHGSS